MFRRRPAIAAALTAVLALVTLQTALAHGHTEVGEYELVIGFHNEPAYQGEPNGLDLFVTNTTTGESVNGLEETLRAEIIFGASTRELQLEPQWGQEGAYTAYLLPTATGDYTWHIFGMIEDTPVDVSMTSGPNTFGSVEAKSVVSFPGAEMSTSDLAASARYALIASGVAVAASLAGLVMGGLALRASRRSR
jgi:hypothetical protein